MNALELWEKFSQASGVHADFEAWSFGAEADALANLVLTGAKTATASCCDAYIASAEPLPQVGQYSVILNSREEAVCIIRTAAVSLIPYRDVTAHHAWKEGEGDRSLQYWRSVHEPFFRAELESIGRTFREDMMVVCEEFLRVYP